MHSTQSSPSSRIRPSEAPILAARTFGKYLISVGSIVRTRLKTAVVKTYPIPRRRFAPLDSPGHVSAEDPAKEGRQDAQLLERRREQASRRAAAWCSATFCIWARSTPRRRRCGARPSRCSTRTRGIRGRWRCFPRIAAPRVAPDASVVQLRLSEMRLCRPRQWGACWLAGQLWQELQLDRFWAERLPPSRKGTRWDQVLQVLVVVPADRAGQRVEAAPRLVRQQRHGRSAGRGFRPGRSAQALRLS